MGRNIEIKAYSSDPLALRQKVEALAGELVQSLHQDDWFFNCLQGRLKLRTFDDGTAELIAYDRADVKQPSMSSYSRTQVQDPLGLRQTLIHSLGWWAHVTKLRHLYMSGRTRIHLDHVEGLGHFVELETVLSEGESQDAGMSEMHRLMQQLGIKSHDLRTLAYADMLAGT